MITESELRSLTSPVVVETSDAVESIYAHAKGQPLDAISAVYRMLLMGAVGVLKQAGQPNKHIARILREYADMVEKESQ